MNITLFNTKKEQNRKAELAKTDDGIFEDLLRECRTMIGKSAYAACHRYIGESDDEYSVALIAFHEAVQSYDDTKGNFASFASMVIRRRLMDYFDSRRKYSNEVIVSPDAFSTDPDESFSPAEQEAFRRQAEETYVSPSAEEEISSVEEILHEYGVTFFELPEYSPKAEKTKAACNEAIAAVVTDPELLHKMRKGKEPKSLPIREITEMTGVSRKTVERHRKYIIAGIVILSGEYPILSSYMPDAKQKVRRIEWSMES